MTGVLEPLLQKFMDGHCYPIFRCEKIVETLSFRRVLGKSIDFHISKLSKITVFYAVLSKEFDNLPLDLYLLKVMSTVLSSSFLS